MLSLSIEKIYPDERLMIDPRESAFSHGMGVFESIQITEGQLQFWSRHWSRLKASASQLFSCDLSDEDESASLEATKEYFQRLGKKDFVLKLSLVVLATGPVLYIYSRERFAYNKLVTLCLNTTYPINENAVHVGHKTHNYLENMWLLEKAKASGYTDYLRVNTKGEVCETCVGNCFFIKGDHIITAPSKSGLFPGVIRDVLLEACPIEQKQILVDDLQAMDGCFITNSIVGILPVQQIANFSNESVLSFSKSLHPKLEEVVGILKTIALSELIDLH